jgi:hypothetical protein
LGAFLTQRLRALRVIPDIGFLQFAVDLVQPLAPGLPAGGLALGAEDIFINSASFKRATMFFFGQPQILARVVELLVWLVGFRIDLIQERLGIFGDELADGFGIGELQVGVDVHLEHAIADRFGDLVLFRTGTAVEHQIQRLGG